MNPNVLKVKALADGQKSSIEIAEIVGLSPRYVRRICQENNFPRLPVGAKDGQLNHQYHCGRRISQDGYVLVTAPQSHPYARKRKNRAQKIILEHRLVMEKKLGRYLLPAEVVDHIDGLTLHNHPDNLRVFENNADHLRETITGKKKHWSPEGHLNIGTRSDRGKVYQPVDTYGRNKKSGDVRLRQILLAWLQLGKDSPYLLGTHRQLEKAQIDYSSRSNLEHALDELYQRWPSIHAR